MKYYPSPYGLLIILIISIPGSFLFLVPPFFLPFPLSPYSLCTKRPLLFSAKTAFELFSIFLL